MIHASSESDKKSRMILEYQAKSPSVDESSCEGSFSGGDGSLKKGPWTAAEDAILVDYIKKHGEGNWNAVQKHTGLSRCGKSCRLRWTNHLRPDLKKGAFTPDEEQLIIKLHAKMGNRWAKMAAHLPGRTDNEIKNYWNTRLKRLQRAGLPLYPSDVCFQSLNEKQSQCGSEFDSDGLDNQLFQPSSCGTADVILDNFNINQGTLSYTQPFPGISASSMLNQGLGSQNYGIIFPTINHQTSFLSFHGNASCGLPALEQFSSFERIHRPFGMFFPHDPDPGSENLAHLVDVLSGSHTLPYGNFSTSQTLPVAVKSELPSLQYPETDLSSWLTTPPTPPSEAGDPHVGSPSSVSVQSDCISPRNSGLLEALLLEAQAMASAENKLSQKNSASSTMMCCDPGEGSAFDLRSMDQRDSFDPISPLGCSAASVFSAYTPPTSVSSLDESPPGKASDGLNGRSKHVEHLAHQGKETEIPPLIDRSRHDALLGSDWCQSVSEVHNAMGDAIAVFLDDLCGEYLHVPLDP